MLGVLLGILCLLVVALWLAFEFLIRYGNVMGCLLRWRDEQEGHGKDGDA